jgi:hypothetical protein
MNGPEDEERVLDSGLLQILYLAQLLKVPITSYSMVTESSQLCAWISLLLSFNRLIGELELELDEDSLPAKLLLSG